MGARQTYTESPEKQMIHEDRMKMFRINDTSTLDKNLELKRLIDSTPNRVLRSETEEIIT